MKIETTQADEKGKEQSLYVPYWITKLNRIIEEVKREYIKK